MRRNYPPYNGKRFLLNLSTNEIHDLDQETKNCQIDEIKSFNLMMFDTMQEAQIHLSFAGKEKNGCYWCNKSFDKG